MNKVNEDQGFEYFQNAPIILSMLQFRYEKIEDFNYEELKRKGAQIKSDFPEMRERFTQQIQLKHNKPDDTTNVSLDERRIDGLQFISKDKKTVLVIGNDKFTFEKHGQYKGWVDFSKEAKKLWEKFEEELSEVKLTGISLRYVNRVNLPKDIHELSDYFTTFIQSSSGSHAFNTFQMKYTSVEPEKNLTTHIGHVLEPPIEDTYPYLFDIDVIFSEQIANEAKVIWNKFEELRSKKNSIFNDGITEKAKQLIR